jgi:hypothetical protein
MDKKQTNRYSDKELSIIKNTFADKPELLIALRKFMLQLQMTKADKEILEAVKDKETLAVVRKAFLPEIDGDAPLNQVIDLWMTVDLKDKTPEQVSDLIESRGMLIQYLEEQLSSLEGVKIEKGLKLSKMIDGTYVGLLTRNTILGHTEMQLQMFSILASQPDAEQVKNRVEANSSR